MLEVVIEPPRVSTLVARVLARYRSPTRKVSCDNWVYARAKSWLALDEVMLKVETNHYPNSGQDKDWVDIKFKVERKEYLDELKPICAEVLDTVKAVYPNTPAKILVAPPEE